MHELGLFRRRGFLIYVLEVGFGGRFTDAQHLGRFFDAEPGCHCEQNAQLGAGQPIELGERFAGKRRDDDRVLNEDCGGGKLAGKISPLPAGKREDGSDQRSRRDSAALAR